MTNWYPYRWVCDNCKAVHYYEVSFCRRCGARRITKLVNSPKLVDALSEEGRHRVAFGPDEVTRETVQGPMVLKDSPVDDDDAVLGTSGEKTVQQPEAPDDLDDMIEDILQG